MEYQTIFYGGLAGAILSLIFSIILYIKLNISEVIEDLTGFSFHKWAKKLQGHSRSKQVQHNKPITREIQPRRDVELEVAVSGSVAATELLTAEEASAASVDSTELLGVESGTSDSTELLGVEPTTSDSTELLEVKFGAGEQDETELLAEHAAATELLSAETGDETVLLNDVLEETTVLTGPASDSKFLKELDVVIVQTNDTI
ncbi:hypothetical protein FAY30_20895 [Bacillus sp. S3]|uniref:hypothetical protein n=1 Tax=Bacillus sp. S3 TaxID=486398 RepID=UPI0011878318|nr:hypothetical protein [Bacillus sp. S3]QCJ44165.1 hypothetical protein FAY30_20895 [Bacillus sp. S3]